MMNQRYTIGQIAQEAGVPASTVRYYERRGLILPSDRSAGNYRLYDAEALERLRFVRSAQASGFTLTDIAELVTLLASDSVPCEAVQGLIEGRLERISVQLEHLRVVERALREWRETCRETAPTGRCAVLEGLGESQ